MSEKCNLMRQHLVTNCQILRCVRSTFVFKAHNFDSYQRFGEHKIYFWLNVFFYAGTPPDGPTPHHCRGFDITTVVRAILDEQSAPDNTQHSQETRIHAPGRDSNPQSQEASGRRYMPRPCDHRHCLFQFSQVEKLQSVRSGRTLKNLRGQT